MAIVCVNSKYWMRLRDLKPEDYHIYVDLDGVLADLTSHIEGVIGHRLKTIGGDGDWENADAIWKQLRKMNEPDFSKISLLPDAMTLWNYIKKYKPNILTATGQPAERNDKQKRQWVKNNLTGYKNVYSVVASRNKAKWAWPDAILIDDRMKSIGPWRERGGIAIHHTSATNTIAELKKLGL